MAEEHPAAIPTPNPLLSHNDKASETQPGIVVDTGTMHTLFKQAGLDSGYPG